MNFNSYDAIGVKMVEELYKQAEELYPIPDVPQKPSLFKRLVNSLKRGSVETTATNACPPNSKPASAHRA